MLGKQAVQRHDTNQRDEHNHHRFGVIDARTPGGRFRRSRGRRIGLGLLQRASALRTEGISLLVGKPTLRAVHHRRALYRCDVLIFGFHSIAAIG